ncbi:MAG: hypothetical protein V4695_10755 [Pseudomonadota bacterium]
MLNPKKFRKLAIAAFLINISLINSVYAGNSSGRIAYTLPTAGILFAFYSGSILNKSACGTSDEWAIDISTPQGRVIAATVMAAQAQGATINVWGQNACNPAFGARESVSHIQIISR